MGVCGAAVERNSTQGCLWSCDGARHSASSLTSEVIPVRGALLDARPCATASSMGVCGAAKELDTAPALSLFQSAERCSTRGLVQPRPPWVSVELRWSSTQRQLSHYSSPRSAARREALCIAQLAQHTLFSVLLQSSPVFSSLFRSSPFFSVLLRSSLVFSSLFRSFPFFSGLLQSFPFFSVLVRSSPFFSVLLWSSPIFSVLLRSSPVFSVLFRSSPVFSVLC